MSNLKKSRTKWLYPSQIEKEYANSLNALCDDIIESVKINVIPMVGDIRQDGVNQDGNWFNKISNAIKKTKESLSNAVAVTTKKVSKVFDRVNAFNERQFLKIIASETGFNLLFPSDFISERKEIFIKENTSLIKSIPERYLDDLAQKIIRAIERGDSKDKLIKIIEDTYSLPRSRAELIVDDQIGKLNGKLAQLRQESAGIEEYDWISLLTGIYRRSEHIRRHKKRFKWSNPPSDGHPGMAIRCKCIPHPIIPSIEELIKRGAKIERV